MKQNVKGWLFLILAAAVPSCLGLVYRIEAFSMRLAEFLILGVAVAGALFLIGYRALGSMPAWAVMALGFPVCYIASGNLPTAILIYTACCGAPLAVSIFWPNFKNIRALTMAALPAAGGIWLGGALLYSKLHFGSWALSSITTRIGWRYLALLKELEGVYAQFYQGDPPPEVGQMFELLREAGKFIGFGGISLAAYILFGSFFISVWLGDRLGSEERWLGSWAELIPSRGISLVYAVASLIWLFLPTGDAQVLQAVLNLFGFLFVFTGVYILRGWMHRKNFKPFWRFILCFLLFALALFSAGGGLLSPYALLSLLGFFIATAPRVRIMKK
jgi:hypothetical protein